MSFEIKYEGRIVGGPCPECGNPVPNHKMDCGSKSTWQKMLDDDEGDFLAGKTCNPNAPEECESCQ